MISPWPHLVSCCPLATVVTGFQPGPGDESLDVNPVSPPLACAAHLLRAHTIRQDCTASSQTHEAEAFVLQ